MPGRTGDGAALLNAIAANPADDTVRLAYADWLDEHAAGDADRARAEFIRLQIAEEAKGGHRPHDRPATPRENELLARWNTPDGWRAGLPAFTALKLQDRYYERGFLSRVEANSVSAFLKAAPGLFARFPVTRVKLRSVTRKTALDLARSPYLAQDWCLDELNATTGDGVAGLATSPYLGGLRQLFLGGPSVAPGLTPPGSRLLPLLENPTLTRLTDFMAPSGKAAGDEVVAGLAAGAFARCLEWVCLYGSRLTAGAAPFLPALARLPALRHLQLGNNGLGDAGAEALAGVTAAGGLHISLGLNGVTDRGAEALLAGPLMRSPRVTLHLSPNPLSDAMRARLTTAFGGRVWV